jgi:hypothetical protein
LPYRFLTVTVESAKPSELRWDSHALEIGLEAHCLKVTTAQQQVDLEPLRPLHLSNGRVYGVELAMGTALHRNAQLSPRVVHNIHPAAIPSSQRSGSTARHRRCRCPRGGHTDACQQIGGIWKHCLWLLPSVRGRVVLRWILHRREPRECGGLGSGQRLFRHP